jgi:hypothetical protein
MNKYKEYKRAWELRNKDKVRESKQRYREANREKLNAAERTRRAKDPDKRRAYAREWWKNNPIKRRDYWYRKKYGISYSQYDTMCQKQHNVCATCFQPELNFETLCVDHNHKTGMVRKLLCHNCNSALGMIGENIETLQNMILYIKEHSNV